MNNIDKIETTTQEIYASKKIIFEEYIKIRDNIKYYTKIMKEKINNLQYLEDENLDKENENITEIYEKLIELNMEKSLITHNYCDNNPEEKISMEIKNLFKIKKELNNHIDMLHNVNTDPDTIINLIKEISEIDDEASALFEQIQYL
jgi:hypothetical protein